MNWFDRHLNWTLIGVWLGGAVLLGSLMGAFTGENNATDSGFDIQVYQDEACSILITEWPDFEWEESEEDGWQKAVWLIYLKNGGTKTVEVNASATPDSPRTAMPGWSVQSETVTLEPGG